MLNLVENNFIENVKLKKNNKYLLAGLKSNQKIEDDLTKWPEYNRIKTFRSNQRNIGTRSWKL